MYQTREIGARQVWRGTKPSPLSAAPALPSKSLRMTSPWRIELFGGLSLVREDQVINRFQTRKTAALLAYLAYYCDKIVSREVLAELLWPETDPDAARNSLRVALTSLRRQLEPPGIPAGAVLFSDRTSIHLNAAACVTDVADFESTLMQERTAISESEKIDLLLTATALYKGALLPGWYEEWIAVEQERLAELYSGALHRLTTLLFQRGDNERALDFARRTVHADPLREEAHRQIMRLHAVMENPSAAREQYQKLELIFQKELKSTPSETTRKLIEDIESGVFLPPARFANVLPPVTDTLAPSHFAVASSVGTEGKSVPRDGSSIPLQFTRFFGRDEEVTRLAAFFQPQNNNRDRPRLVTLTGPGGIGKTRLSVVVAARLRDATPHFAGRTWVVSLADLTESSQIAPTILATINRLSDPKADPFSQVLEVLSEGPAFLVLDNMEQFADGADFVRALLEQLPQVCLLVTSRQRLGVEGEREFPLLPLPAPEPDAALVIPEIVAAYPSVALFVDRVQAVRPDFQVTPRNALAIATLCHRLDGLPLALELAAAWARLLTPAQMVERLSERFELLISERRDLSPRHRSLRAVMEESWRLLPDSLGRFVQKLTVFRGGWTLAAAEAVCASADDRVAENISLLLQHSLVYLEETESGIRFRMLDSVRAYAEEKISVQDAARFRDAHTAYFASYAVFLAPYLSGSQSETFLNTLESDYENFRLALRHALQKNGIDTALQISASIWRFWCAKGYAEEGYRFLDACLKASTSAEQETVVLRVIAHNGAGRLAMSMGKVHVGTEHFQQCLVLMENQPAQNDTDLTTTVLANLGIAARAGGDYEAARVAYTRLAQVYHVQDPWALSCALGGLGGAFHALRNEAEARVAFEESQRIRRLWGDKWGAGEHNHDSLGMAGTYLSLGHIAAEQGDYTTAQELLRDALAAYRDCGDEMGCALVWERIAIATAQQRDWTKCAQAADECFLLRREYHAAQPVITFTIQLQHAAQQQKYPLVVPHADEKTL